jgi:hypothetical protein
MNPLSTPMKQTTHETYFRDETVIAGSDRSFGIVMTIAFAAISLLNWCTTVTRGVGPAESHFFFLRRPYSILPR